MAHFWPWNNLKNRYVILTWRDGSNEMVRSSRFRSRWRNQYILNFENWIFNFGTPLKFLFSSTTTFFYPKFSNPYCRKGSHGPYGAFWFSAKKWFWSVKINRESTFLEKSGFFISSGKWMYFVEVSFWKGPLLEFPWKLIFSFSDSEKLNPF